MTIDLSGSAVPLLVGAGVGAVAALVSAHARLTAVRAKLDLAAAKKERRRAHRDRKAAAKLRRKMQRDFLFGPTTADRDLMKRPREDDRPDGNDDGEADDAAPA